MDLRAIEQNLNSISRTPNLHRQEMLRFVYPPDIIRWTYQPCCWTNKVTSGVLQSLYNVYEGLDIWQDPYVVRLVADSSDSSEKQLQKVLRSRKTYCLDQMKMLYSKCKRMFEELGSWAAEVYLISCINKFSSHVESDSNLLNDWEDEEKVYLLGILNRVDVVLPSAPISPESWQLSQKAHRFIDLLVQQDLSDFTGLVFVQERATVGMLSQLLSIHPRTKDAFLTSTFVGTSNSSKRKLNIGELLDVRDQKDTLDDLRYGRKNLVIATSVLEEGIDVSACNIVICFDKPANLKSFIQRRGRARKEKSKFVLMLSSEDPFTSSQWRELEDDMKKAYQDEMRQLEEIQKGEDVVEEGSRLFRIDSTGYVHIISAALLHEH